MLCVILLFVACRAAAQPMSIAATPSTQCYSVSGNTVTAFVTIPASSVTSYSWSVNTSSCSISGLTTFGANSSTAAITFSCCGVGTVICTAYNGTAFVTSASTTFTINCPPPVNITANPATNTICSGSSAGLSASGAITYSWSTGSFSPFITVTPTTNTCYTLFGIGANSCTATTMKCYSVVAPPSLTVTGPNSICPGGTASLAASGAVTYTWNPGNIAGGNVVVSPGSSTCYTITGQSANGCLATAPKCITVLTAPSMSVSGPSQVCAGSATVLVASGALSYSWSTGANTPSVVINPTTTSTYSVQGTGSSGCTGQATKVVSVTPQPAVSAVASATAGNAVFNASVSPLYTPATYSWTFGNGGTYSTTGSSSAATTYTSGGTYSYSVLYSGPGGCTGNYADTVVIGITPCTVTANFTSSQGPNGVVTFSSTSAGTGTSTTYYWDFGDGGNSSLPAPTHTYLSGGSYTVMLDVQNPGCFDTITKVISVSMYTCNLAAGFSYTHTGSGQVAFTSTSTGVQQGYYYLWTFGNTTANGSTAVHTYSASGNYTVTLYVASSVSSPSCASTYSAIVSVSISPCAVNANLTHNAGPGGQISFTSTSTGTFTGSTFLWNFGDGTSGSGQTPVHYYTNAGTHYVMLTVTNPGGQCLDTLTQAVNITGISCTANSAFTLVPTQTPQYWNAIPAYPWNVSNAVWSWGDGSSSNGLYTSHQYSAAGNYNICLSVTVSCLASSSACATYSVYRPSGASAIVYVNVIKPTVIFVGTEEPGIDNAFRMYPNPSTGKITIAGEMLSAESQLGIYDMSGRLIDQRTMYHENGRLEESLELSMQEGIYLVRLSSSNREQTARLVIVRE
jgi:PKD repeat protein